VDRFSAQCLAVNRRHIPERDPLCRPPTKWGYPVPFGPEKLR
jgi:hypothetical protein